MFTSTKQTYAVRPRLYIAPVEREKTPKVVPIVDVEVFPTLSPQINNETQEVEVVESTQINN
ncbi:hypothetical protein LguiA_033652 [Lonicera macranthoides]